MKSSIRILSLISSVLWTLGCVTGARAPRHAQPPELASLRESEVLALIRGWLRDDKLSAQPGWSVDLPQRGPVPVDLRLGKLRVGIEWVSPEDRARYGSVLPPPDPQGQLRVVQGAGGELVLLLDHTSYRYEPNDPRALLANLDLGSAEDRLKRDVEDFLAYLQSQYAL